MKYTQRSIAFMLRKVNQYSKNIDLVNIFKKF